MFLTVCPSLWDFTRVPVVDTFGILDGFMSIDFFWEDLLFVCDVKQERFIQTLRVLDSFKIFYLFRNQWNL